MTSDLVLSMMTSYCVQIAADLHVLPVTIAVAILNLEVRSLTSYAIRCKNKTNTRGASKAWLRKTL